MSVAWGQLIHIILVIFSAGKSFIQVFVRIVISWYTFTLGKNHSWKILYDLFPTADSTKRTFLLTDFPNFLTGPESGILCEFSK